MKEYVTNKKRHKFITFITKLCEGPEKALRMFENFVLLNAISIINLNENLQYDNHENAEMMNHNGESYKLLRFLAIKWLYTQIQLSNRES